MQNWKNGGEFKSKTNFQYELSNIDMKELYTNIDGISLNKRVIISKNWMSFFDNYVTIPGWIEMKKV